MAYDERKGCKVNERMRIMKETIDHFHNDIYVLMT